MIHGLAGVNDLSITSGNSMVNIPCMTAHLVSYIIRAFAYFALKYFHRSCRITGCDLAVSRRHRWKGGKELGRIRIFRAN